MIRAIHDVKGIDMGNSLVRYKVRRCGWTYYFWCCSFYLNILYFQAEMDFDGRELTRFYLDKQELKVLLDVSNRKHVLIKKTLKFILHVIIFSK